MNNITRSLLDAGRRHSAFYERNLANHLPMTLIALDGLGASDAQIVAFAARYEKKLGPVPAATGETRLGRPEDYGSWVVFFDAELTRDGVEKTAGLWASRLMPGVGSFAFHGLIRVAYALEGGDAAEMARALASWAASYAELGALPPASASTAPPLEALAALKTDGTITRRRYAGRRIADRMASAAADPETARIIAAAGKADIASLAEAMLAAYAATGDFTVLHGLTACHAFRALRPLLDDSALGERFLWQALVCAYLSAGGPTAGSPLNGDESLSWEEIRRRAAVATDEHDIKLAYAAWREWQHYGDDCYRRIASATLAPPQ